MRTVNTAEPQAGLISTSGLRTSSPQARVVSAEVIHLTRCIAQRPGRTDKRNESDASTGSSFVSGDRRANRQFVANKLDNSTPCGCWFLDRLPRRFQNSGQGELVHAWSGWPLTL